jgi:hypothetical protein
VSSGFIIIIFEIEIVGSLKNEGLQLNLNENELLDQLGRLIVYSLAIMSQ